MRLTTSTHHHYHHHLQIISWSRCWLYVSAFRAAQHVPCNSLRQRGCAEKGWPPQPQSCLAAEAVPLASVCAAFCAEPWRPTLCVLAEAASSLSSEPTTLKYDLRVDDRPHWTKLKNNNEAVSSG